jgi:amino acid permease
MCISIMILVPVFSAAKVYDQGEAAMVLQGLSQIITIPLYICLFVFWKYKNNTKLVPLLEVDLLSDNILISERLADMEENVWPFK